MRLPVGVSNFRKLIEPSESQDAYAFVDKTRFIKAILDDGAEVALITRPRRFGKTLNMSMLHHFFASHVGGKPTKGLFDRLNISQAGDRYLQHQGKYPVIYLTLKDIKESTMDLAILGFKRAIQNLCSEHKALLSSPKLDDYQKRQFKTLLSGYTTLVDIKGAIRDLVTWLYDHHGMNTFILIDEYDTPLQYAYEQGYYEEMVAFMRGFLGAGLKDNAYLHKAVLTGILRISKENLFSDLNHLVTYSVLDSKYGEYFGFSEEEVTNLLTQVGLTTAIDHIKNWFNGYQFGKHVVYNPWSIIRSLEEQGELKPYWVNTSENTLIKELIVRSSPRIKQDVEQLLQGDAVEKRVNPNMSFGDLVETEPGLWTLLLMSGYLKPVSQRYVSGISMTCQLAIPNQEVMELYRTIIQQWLSGNKAMMDEENLLVDLLAGNIAGFEKKLKDFMQQVVSVHDVRQDTQEHFYHALLLGVAVFIPKDHYVVKSNREAGDGRFDLMLLSRRPGHLSVILEFKAVKSSATDSLRQAKLDKAAQAGLQQIEDKTYAAELAQQGVSITQVLKVSIAFSGKSVSVRSHADKVV